MNGTRLAALWIFVLAAGAAPRPAPSVDPGGVARLAGSGALDPSGDLAGTSVSTGAASPGQAPGGAHAIGPARAATADYRAVTNDLSNVANFNVETRRGVLIYGASEEIWALNTHASTLNRYGLSTSAPLARYRTVLNPVSLALWDDDLLVVGAGTRALVRHDRATGRITGLVDLPSEPFDLVLDEDLDRAFVSCLGEGLVAEIDLIAFQLVAEHPVSGRRAAYLWLDGGDPLDASDNELFVAPLLSGNNSLVLGQPKAAAIVDGDDLASFPAGGLPDIDLLSINTSTGARTTWGTHQGTLLFGHGKNPVTGEYWLLNIESHNQDPALQSEPALQGIFAENRVSITDFGASPSLPARPDRVVALDVTTSGAPGDPLSVSTPTDVEFDPVTGGAWIVSPTSDVLAYLDANGVRQHALDVQLPEGSIPRQFVRDPSGARGLIYCWGTNQILVLSLVPPNQNTIVFTFELGLDPLPEFLRAGREIFYDAHNSRNARTTCGHCHPGGGADGLAWSIPDSPIDEKGVMVTQSLLGIADTFPHHWRGERDLVDFNVAFAGLLGGDQLDPAPGGDLDRFVAFVQSLRSHANPHADVTRRVIDARTPEPIGSTGLPGSAVNGQRVFHDKPSDSATATCTTCHFDPTGSPGDVFDDIEAAPIPARVHIEPAHFDNVLSFKDQELVDVVTQTGTLKVQELGFGWGHNGTIPDLFAFLKTFALLTSQEQRDVTAFLRQFDTGLSPAAQKAYRVAPDAPGGAVAAAAQVGAILLPQAARHWIDVAAFGTDRITGGVLRRSWFWDPAQALFVGEDPETPPLDFAAFSQAAALGELDLVVLGVPPGSGRRLGIDQDDDGLDNEAEAEHGCDPWAPDSDGDGFLDGYEVLHGSDPLVVTSAPADSTPPAITWIERDFVNARVAKVLWTTDEPATVEIAYGAPGGQSYVWRGASPTTRHTTVLTFDESSGLVLQNFLATAILTDPAGNQAVLPFTGWAAGTMLNPFSERLLQVAGLAFVATTPGPGGSLAATAEVEVRYKETQNPATGVVVIAQVLTEDLATGHFVIAAPATNLPISFVVDPAGLAPYTALPGPFLVLPPTDAAARSTATFTLTGLTAGQRVKLNVIAVEAAGPAYDPEQPVFLAPTLSDYSLPTTQPTARCIELTY